MLISNAPLVNRNIPLAENFLRAYFDPPWTLIAGGRSREFALKALPRLMEWVKQQQDLKRNVLVPLPNAGANVWHLALKAPLGIRPAEFRLPASLEIEADEYSLLWRSQNPIPLGTAKLLSEKMAREIGGGAREALNETFPLPGTIYHRLIARLERRFPVRMMPTRATAYRLSGDALVDSTAQPVASGITRADKMKAKPVDWLWNNFIPIGAVTLLGGAGGMGKGTLAADITGIVSSGIKWPTGEKCEAGSVLFLSGEGEDLEREVMPRLLAAGADLKRVGLGAGADLRRAEFLEDQVRQHPNLRLVVLSPIRMFFGSAELHGNIGVRAALEPLQAWADRHRVAILGIIHPEKGKEHKEAFAGSKAWFEVARAAYSLIPDPKDKNPIIKQKRRLFVTAKNNLGPDNVSLPYRLDGTAVNGISTSRVVWG